MFASQGGTSDKFLKDGQKVGETGLPIAAGLTVGAIVALPIAFIGSIFLTAPGKALPFNFLDRFYPPRVAEKAAIQAKFEKAQAAKKAEADKAKAAEAAAAKAAEAEAAKAAAATAAKK